MRRWLVLLLLLALVMPSGCAYTRITIPYDTDLQETRMGSKVGISQFQSVLWLVAWGDGGTQAAAQQGELETVNHMDREMLAVLGGLYYRQTTIVYGD